MPKSNKRRGKKGMKKTMRGGIKGVLSDEAARQLEKPKREYSIGSVFDDPVEEFEDLAKSASRRAKREYSLTSEDDNDKTNPWVLGGLSVLGVGAITVVVFASTGVIKTH